MHEADSRRLHRAEVLPVVLIDGQHEVDIAGAHRRLGVGRRIDDDDPALLQPGD